MIYVITMGPTIAIWFGLCCYFDEIYHGGSPVLAPIKKRLRARQQRRWEAQTRHQRTLRNIARLERELFG